MGKVGKGLFQDEPEEVRKVAIIGRLFGAEPEERPSSKKPRAERSASSSARPIVLFGDEGEERECRPTSQPQHNEDSDDEGASPQQATLNLDWSAMKLFSHSSFLQKSVALSQPERKKRPYDNTKRSEQAENNMKHVVTSFKDSALQPGRLEALCKQQQCKCALKTCFKQLDLTECRRFLETFWFVRRGRSASGDDPELDIEASEVDPEDIKGWLDRP
ncbi:unnamed protein product, partial [Durusdinium trenchii]